MSKLLIVLVAVFCWYQGLSQVSKLTTDTPKGIYTIKGDYYFDHNNYADAIKNYNESLNKDSNNAYVIIKVAESYLRSDYSEIADQWYIKAFNLNPNIDEKFTPKYISKLIKNNSYDELRQISENSFEDLSKPGEISIYNSNGEIIKLYDSNNENLKFDFIPGLGYKLIINYDNYKNEIIGSNKSETDLLERNNYTFHIQKLVENISQQSGKSARVEDIHINPGDLVTFQLIPNPSSYSNLNNSRIRYNQGEVNINSKNTLVFSYVAELSPSSTTNDSTLLSENFKKLYNDDSSMNNIISDTTSISEPTFAKNIQPDNVEEKNVISLSNIETEDSDSLLPQDSLSSDVETASQEIDLSGNKEDSIQLATQNNVALLNDQVLEQAQQEEQSIDPNEEEETVSQDDIVLLPDTTLTNTDIVDSDTKQSNLIDSLTSAEEIALQKEDLPDISLKEDSVSVIEQTDNEIAIAQQQDDLINESKTLVDKELSIDSIQLTTPNVIALLNEQTLQEEEKEVIELAPETTLTNTDIVDTETEQTNLTESLISDEEVTAQKEDLHNISLIEDSGNIIEQTDNELAIAQKQYDLLDDSQTLVDKVPSIDSTQLATPNVVALLNEQPSEQTLQEELQDKQEVIELIPETSLTSTDISENVRVNQTDSLTSTEEVVTQAEDLHDINLNEDSGNIIEQADNELAIDQQQDDLLDQSQPLVEKDQIIDANPTPNDLINSEDNTVQFRVQIAAARSEISDQQLKKIYNGSKTIFTFNEDGYYKYAIEETPIYFDAKQALYESNVKNAFIAAYLGDTKLKLQDAIARQNMKPIENTQFRDENKNPITENEQAEEFVQNDNQENIDTSSENLPTNEVIVADTDEPNTTDDILTNTEESVAQVESIPEDKPSSEITTIPNDDKITMTQQQTELLDEKKIHIEKELIDSTQLSTSNTVALLNEQPSEQTLQDEIKEQSIEPSNVINKEEENELIPETTLTNTDIVDTDFEQTSLTESLISDEEVSAQKEDLLNENITLVEKDQIIDASPAPIDIISSENNNVQFRVQIAAAKSEISDTQLEKIYSGSKDIFNFQEDGYYKYAIEETPSYSDAKQTLYESDVKNAFIAAYLGDTKLKLQDAIARQNRSPIDQIPLEDKNIIPITENDQTNEIGQKDKQEYIDSPPEKLSTDEEVTIVDTDKLDTTDSLANTVESVAQVESVPEDIQSSENTTEHIDNETSDTLLPTDSPDKNITKETLLDSSTTYGNENNDFQYRVQIAAAKSEISSTRLSNMYSGSKAIFSYNEDGYYKYAIEETSSYFTAKQTLKESEHEYAFIVAYKEGIKLNLQDAIALQYKVPMVNNELAKSDSVLNVVTVNFEFDEFKTPPIEKSSLQEHIIDHLKINKSYYVIVNGYTDIIGSGTYNFGLSQERALYVKQLIINEGISTQRVTTQYFGESQLIKYCPEDENCDESIHQANRRVEVLLLISK